MSELHTWAATSFFFADDSTLLSFSLTGVNVQLGIVQDYCHVSGEKLKLSKLTLLALNWHQLCNRWQRWKYSHYSSHWRTLKFHSVNHQWVIWWLKFQKIVSMEIPSVVTSIPNPLWKINGGTSMASSRFWHFTTHFGIPQHLRPRWQKMLAGSSNQTKYNWRPNFFTFTTNNKSV